MKLHNIGLGMGLLLVLAACGQPNTGQMSQESYFPPLGLGQEAVALERRRELTAIKRHPKPRLQTRVPNTPVPLETVVFDDKISFAETKHTGQPRLPLNP